MRLPPPPYKTDPSIHARYSILIVDDERLVTRVLSRVFRQHHLTITHRVSDAVALQEKQGWAFDVALCDIMIPPHTGLDFFEACRKAAPGLESQIIFMSGGPTNRALARRLDTLPNTLLEKPFDLVELRSIVLDLAARID